MPFSEDSTQVLHSLSGVLVGAAALVVGASYLLGIDFRHPEQFLNVQEWVQAFNDCLHSF